MGRTTLRMLVASTILAGWAAGAHAQDTGAAPTDAADAEIVVVGTSVRAKLAEIERQPTPIQVLSAESISLAGQRSVGDLLRTQPAFSGTSSSADGVGLGRQTLNLRGVGDQYTLSLINGRRFAVNGAANVGIIPFHAIERIEVLTAGASSIYGSDAVAGVVNIAMRRDADGIGGEARYGDGFAGLREQQYSAYIGSRGDNGGYILAVDHFVREGLLGADLPAGTNNLTRFGFLDFRSDFTNPGRITLPNGSDVILDTSRFGPGQFSNNPADYRAYDPARDNYDRQRGGVYAISPSKRTSVYFGGHRDLSAATTVTLDVLANRTDDRYVTGSSVAPIDVPATNPYNPFGVAVTSNYRFSDFGPGPFNEGQGNINDFRLNTINAALRLEHQFSSSLSFALTGNYFREEAQQRIPNAYSTLGLTNAVNRTGADAFNPFCNRCNTPAQLAGVLVGTRVDRTSELRDFDARLTGTLLTLPGGDLKFAVGAAYREEEFQVDPDALYAQGGLVDQGVITQQNLVRNVKSVFAELRAPIIERLEVQAAARYEDYSDFGGTFNPLIAARWEVVPSNITLRASYSTSFRAPFLQDLTNEQVQSQTGVVDPTTNTTVNVVALSGGNPNLTSEDGRTFSFGAVLTPTFAPGLSVTIDYYDLKQSDLVISPTPQAVISGLAPGTVLRGPNVGGAGRDILITALKANGGSREVRGVDFLVRYQSRLGSDGNIVFDLSGTRLIDYKFDARTGEGLVQQAGIYSPTFGGLPRWKLTFGPTVSFGPATVSGRVRHVGGYTAPGLFGFADRPVEAVSYVDLSGRLNLGEDGLRIVPGVELKLGVTNLFDKRPPFVPNAVLFFSDNAPWDRGNHDIGGRIVYGSVGFKF